MARMEQRQVRRAVPVPTHCEAYPSFSLPGVARRWRDRELFCEWVDEFSGLAGQMELKRYSEIELFVLYSFGKDTYRHQRGGHFDVKLCPQISHKIEPRVFCPACYRLIAKLFFRSGRWACRHCHGLVERRSLLTSEQKLIVRREKLIRQVHGRPARSSYTFDRDRFELIRLNKYFDDMTPFLEPPLRHVLGQAWFRDEGGCTEVNDGDHPPAYLDVHVPLQRAVR